MANTTIPSELIAADAITGAKIADNAVDSEHYTDGSIDTAHIADSQVTVGKMAANSVDSDQYVDGSIDLIHMSVNSVDSDQYVDGSIDTAHIADAQITVGKMAANSVDSDQYVDGSIDLIHMSVNSVDSDQYVDGSIDLIHMSVNSIDSDQYVDGSIDTIHIADDAVTGAKIENAVTIATSVTSPLIDGTNFKINGAQGSDGQVLTSTGSGVAWEAAGGGVAGIVSNADATAITIDSSENVGIGTGSPTQKLHVNGESRFEDYLYGSTANGKLYINEDVAIVAGKKLYLDTGSNTYLSQVLADTINFVTDGGERMRIDNTGRVLMNATGIFASSSAQLYITGTAGIVIRTNDYTNYQPIILHNNAGNGDNSSTLNYITFQSLSNGTVGTITSVGTTTSYNTSSDYRLKENVDYTWDATTRLKQLKPARFNWIADETNTLVDGFLAHEVSSIVPEAITGVKDETETSENCVLNAAGKLEIAGVTEAEWIAGKIETLWTEDDELPEGVSVGDVKEKADYASDTTWVASHTQDLNQSIDQSKLVPLLVKTIQELEARITVLEG